MKSEVLYAVPMAYAIRCSPKLAAIKPLVFLLASVTLMGATAQSALCDSNIATAPSKHKAGVALANIAVPFEENRGQADANVAFQARTLVGPLFVIKNGELAWSLKY